MEQFDILDSARRRLGKLGERGVPLKPGEYRQVVSVWLFNSQGQFLVQQRQATKHSWPNYWDTSASGAVIAGETSQEAAMRELREELGLQLDLTNTPVRLSVAFEEGWDDIYVIKLDVAIADLTLQKNEVSAAKWIDATELVTMLENGTFIPYIYSKSIFDYYASASEYLPM